MKSSNSGILTKAGMHIKKKEKKTQIPFKKGLDS